MGLREEGTGGLGLREEGLGVAGLLGLTEEGQRAGRGPGLLGLREEKLGARTPGSEEGGAGGPDGEMALGGVVGHSPKATTPAPPPPQLSSFVL